jgi:hypothetical protein
LTNDPVPAAVGSPGESSGTGSGAAAETSAIVADTTERDDEALSLREQGRSFAAIARALGFEGASPANAAFNRALRRLPPSDQEHSRKREMARLDVLGERLRQRQDLDEAEMARRARTLERLRKKLSA